MLRLSVNIIALLFLLALALPGWDHNAYAADAGKGTKPAVSRNSGRSESSVVTDSQKARLKEISLKYRSSARPMLKQYAAEMYALKQLIHARAVDEAAIRTQVAKISAIEADLAVRRAYFMRDLRTVLTPEQIKSLKQAKSTKSDEKIDSFLSGIAGDVLPK